MRILKKLIAFVVRVSIVVFFVMGFFAVAVILFVPFPNHRGKVERLLGTIEGVRITVVEPTKRYKASNNYGYSTANESNSVIVSHKTTTCFLNVYVGDSTIVFMTRDPRLIERCALLRTGSKFPMARDDQGGMLFVFPDMPVIVHPPPEEIGREI